MSWQSDVIETLRHQHSKDLQKVVDIVLSHQVNFCMVDDFYANETIFDIGSDFIHRV
jgi:hypothetical protein